MAIKEAYVSQLGRDYKISEHFTLGEFQCKDGSDRVLYSEELLEKEEELRALLGGDAEDVKVLFTSAYRTASHNASPNVRGAKNSQHLYGTAVDMKVKKNGQYIDAQLLCCLCQDLKFKGIGYISSTALHVDMRTSGSYRGDERKGYRNNVNNFYSYFNISKAQVNALKVNVPDTNVGHKSEEEDEMIYKDINEVPSYYKEAVQLRIDHGLTDGKNITESMCRIWTVEDRENPYIVDMDDVPAWAKPEIQALINAGKIKGNGKEQIGKRWQVLEALIMASR